VLNPASLGQLPQVDSVLYCIGLDRSAGASMRQVYVEGLGHVLDRLPRPGRFLYVSSTSVYGQTEGEEVDETAVTEPLDEGGKVVLTAEQLLKVHLPQAIILRFAGIYGPGRLLRQEAIRTGQPLTTNPDHLLNLIHVEDGAAAVVAAEQSAAPGQVYNVSDGHPVCRGAFYRQLAEILKAPPPLFVRDSDTPLSQRDRANRRICNRKMLEALRVKLKYPTFREGLAAC
jgi:nucleoside-diphosphate-sugar epimerase